MIQQKYGLKEDYLKSILQEASPFSDIDNKKVDEFIQYLLENKYLEYINGEYLLGTEIEKEYGYNLVMNFISVFETLPQYSIIYRNK
jgi:ATP-dependent Lhr-like helicase